jgi:hypothetical protein
MTPGVRKFALTVHLTCSVGWIGAVVAYLVLGLTAVTNPDAATVRAAWIAMDVTGWWAIVPLAIAALLTGLVMSLGTHWGLFRHYWVLISLVLTFLSTVVLLLHMPTVSAMANLARIADGANLRALGGDLFHPGVGLVVLLAITVLNVYKPVGVTPYGWRKQNEVAQRNVQRSAPSVSVPPAGRVELSLILGLRAVAAGLGYFLFHFAEMFVAMMLGMVVFVSVGLALTAQGYTGLLDGSSSIFQVGMAAFMVAPMVVWMRVRGGMWQHGAEMGTAMLIPVVAVILLERVGLSEGMPWLASSEHPAMVVGMLAWMLYRRAHYTSGYSFARWPAAASGQSSGAHLAEAGNGHD